MVVAAFDPHCHLHVISVFTIASSTCYFLVLLGFTLYILLRVQYCNLVFFWLFFVSYPHNVSTVMTTDILVWLPESGQRTRHLSGASSVRIRLSRTLDPHKRNRYPDSSADQVRGACHFTLLVYWTSKMYSVICTHPKLIEGATLTFSLYNT